MQVGSISGYNDGGAKTAHYGMHYVDGGSGAHSGAHPKVCAQRCRFRRVLPLGSVGFCRLLSPGLPAATSRGMCAGRCPLSGVAVALLDDEQAGRGCATLLPCCLCVSSAQCHVSQCHVSRLLNAMCLCVLRGCVCMWRATRLV